MPHLLTLCHRMRGAIMHKHTKELGSNCINTPKNLVSCTFPLLFFGNSTLSTRSNRGKEKDGQTPHQRRIAIRQLTDSHPGAIRTAIRLGSDSYLSRVRQLFGPCPIAIGLLIAHSLSIAAPPSDAQCPVSGSYNCRILGNIFHVSGYNTARYKPLNGEESRISSRIFCPAQIRDSRNTNIQFDILSNRVYPNYAESAMR